MNPFKTWIYLLIPLLLLNVKQTQCEVYSLIYIYTAFSKPVDLPGIHEFIAMAQLDGRTIQYYDSDNQKLVPKQPWIKERLPAEYWVKGTQDRQREQQWFKVNFDILMKRMGQNDTDTHILQWQHGCEGDMQPDGTLQFKQGWDMYNYDGKIFLYDYINGDWVDQIDAETEWKGPLLKEYNRRQQIECIERLRRFITYGEKQLQTASPPEVFLFATNAKVSANAVLVCLATGFYSNDTKLQIRKDERLLDRSDGVITSGVRPNGINGTFQRRDEVEIVREEVAQYTCEVNHKTLKNPVLKVWDHKLPVHPSGDFPIAAVAGAVAAIVLGVGIAIGVLYKKRIIGRTAVMVGALVICVINALHVAALVLYDRSIIDQKLPVHPSGDFPIGLVVCALVVIVIYAVVLVLILLYKKRIIGGSMAGSRPGSNPSLGSKISKNFGSNRSLGRKTWNSSNDSGLIPMTSLPTATPPTPESEHLMEEETALSPSENYQDSLSSLQPT